MRRITLRYNQRRAVIFRFPLRVYPFEVVVAFGCKDTEVVRYITKLNDGQPLLERTKADIRMDDGAGGKTVHFTDGDCLIRLRRVPKTPAGRGILAHEVSHVVEYVMEKIGMPHAHDSREAWAYLTEYITEQIYQRTEPAKK